jgi:glycolate oxidase iron-sulfur subunit
VSGFGAGKSKALALDGAGKSKALALDGAGKSKALALDGAGKSKARALDGAGDKPLYEDYSKCIHCGLCLNACPTYRELHLESDSPRGRIYQMIQVDEGRLELGDSFVQHMDLCLDCRSCETACPSNVPYGRLIEAARAQIHEHYRRPLLERWGRAFFYEHLLTRPALMKLFGYALVFYQRSGLRDLMRKSGILEGWGLAGVEAVAPDAEPPFFFSEIGKVFPAIGERRYRVAFFAGCLANVTHARMNEATVRVLRANGCEVAIPSGQGCCGALHVHAGVRDTARELARRNIAAFLSQPFDALLTNAAGCGSTLKEYGELLPGDAPALEFSKKMEDVTEFLARVGLTQPLGKVAGVITYQDPCHLAHGQRVRAAPRQLIRQIPGITYRELPRTEICCGSAGVYNVLHNDLAMDLLRHKMADIGDTGADVVLTANPGCLLQIRAGVRLFPEHKAPRVLHVMELLDESARLS